MADLASICSVENIVLGEGKEKRLRKNKEKKIGWPETGEKKRLGDERKTWKKGEKMEEMRRDETKEEDQR